MSSPLLFNPLVEPWLLRLKPLPVLKQGDTSLWVGVLFSFLRPPLKVIAGGIAFQFAAVVVYMLLSTEFFVRFLLKKPFPGREDTIYGAPPSVLDSRTKQMIVGVGLSTLAMFIR
jgi:hypothetical protein